MWHRFCALRGRRLHSALTTSRTRGRYAHFAREKRSLLSVAPYLVSRIARVVIFIVVAVVTALSSAHAASISVTWNAPTTNADGTSLTDLVGYRIYLDTTPP